MAVTALYALQNGFLGFERSGLFYGERSAERVPVPVACYLVKTTSGAILFDTGVSPRAVPGLLRNDPLARFEDADLLVHRLDALGLEPGDVDVVVLSHLHFDHAGGLLAAWREGEPPRLLFPKATYLVSAEAWQRASDPHPRDRASFIPELTPLLEASGRLELVDAEHSPALGKAVRFHFSQGHTPGLMLSEISAGKDAHGYDHGGVVFCSDLIPGRPWVHLPVTMGYDRAPELLIDEKRDFLDDMLARDVHLYFTHDPECALARVTRDAKGRYGTEHEVPGLHARALAA